MVGVTAKNNKYASVCINISRSTHNSDRGVCRERPLAYVTGRKVLQRPQGVYGTTPVSFRIRLCVFMQPLCNKKSFAVESVIEFPRFRLLLWVFANRGLIRIVRSKG